MTPLTAVFAEYFAAWSIELPTEAVDGRRDGQLHARGWTIRWRWRDGERLEVRATHRMTNERWFVVAPDGATTSLDVPAEMYRTDVPGAEEAYREAWAAHGRARDAAGMRPRQLEVPDEARRPDGMLWALDGEDARYSPDA